MGRVKKEAEASYKEFELLGDHFQYTGRIYPKNISKSDKVDKYFMYLCINKVFTIQAHFVETDQKSFITFPEYKLKEKKNNKDYASYVYTDKELNKDFDALAKVLHDLV